MLSTKVFTERVAVAGECLGVVAVDDAAMEVSHWPPKPFHMLPCHPLKLRIRQLRIPLDQLHTILHHHAHGHANTRRVERARTPGGIFGYGILTSDDEAGDVGHFDELGDGWFIFSLTFIARLQRDIQRTLGNILAEFRIGRPCDAPFPKGGGGNASVLEGEFHGVSFIVGSTFAENPSILGNQHSPTNGTWKRSIKGPLPSRGGHADGLSHHFLVLFCLFAFLLFFFLVAITDSIVTINNGIVAVENSKNFSNIFFSFSSLVKSIDIDQLVHDLFFIIFLFILIFGSQWTTDGRVTCCLHGWRVTCCLGRCKRCTS
mmetsp:Transcript_2298/g.4102  ORF Transcript_2298/g.4102 Transcript_2298/m.4102 type:complete len:317 (+) Transcript_2298:1221-2171(+)